MKIYIQIIIFLIFTSCNNFTKERIDWNNKLKEEVNKNLILQEKLKDKTLENNRLMNQYDSVIDMLEIARLKHSPDNMVILYKSKTRKEGKLEYIFFSDNKIVTKILSEICNLKIGVWKQKGDSIIIKYDKYLRSNEITETSSDCPTCVDVVSLIGIEMIVSDYDERESLCWHDIVHEILSKKDVLWSVKDYYVDKNNYKDYLKYDSIGTYMVQY